MCQAIMANTDKLAILAVMTWLHMTMNMADICVYAKNRENVQEALPICPQNTFLESLEHEEWENTQS